MRDLDMNKSTVSLLFNGKQEWGRDDVLAFADYLHIRPYELLMHPDDAMAIRRMRDAAVRIASEPPEQAQDGTRAAASR